MKTIKHLALLSLVLTAAAESNTTVDSIAALERTVATARPGDTIVLADGVYDATECALAATGEANALIMIRARNVGSATLRCPVRLRGDHLVLQGFAFTGKGSVIVRGDDCRVTRCRMNDVQSGCWLRVESGSMRIEIDHCRFENKTNNKALPRGCQLLQIIVNNRGEAHHVHHNHFRDVPQGGGNGFETLQLITRSNPFDPPPGHCETVIENNLFERCNGEAEVISVKSNGNLLCGNTFRACRGALVLRHGDDNLVSGNFFFGDGEAGAGGVRLQGTDQTVVNNYFRDLENFGVAMMDGTPDNLYVRTERARILFNTFVDCRPALLVGANHALHPNGTVPKDCVIGNNIFQLAADGAIVELVQGDQPEGWTWIGNVANGKLGIPLIDGIRMQDPELQFLPSGVAVPGKAVSAAGDFRDVTVDALGAPRGAKKEVGAVELPIRASRRGPLKQQDVGPRADRALTR